MSNDKDQFTLTVTIQPSPGLEDIINQDLAGYFMDQLAEALQDIYRAWWEHDNPFVFDIEEAKD